jgi:hypothetical protein
MLQESIAAFRPSGARDVKGLLRPGHYARNVVTRDERRARGRIESL